MKKTLVIVLVLCLALVVVYLGASYRIAGQAHKYHDDLIAQVNLSNYLEASTKSYERGLFSSVSRTTFTVTMPENLSGFKFSTINTIHHGPFVFLENPNVKLGLRPVLAVVQTRLDAGDSAEPLKKALETVPELQSSEVLTVLSFDGSAESYLDVPSFQKEFPDDKVRQVHLEWGGFTAKSIFESGPGKVTGSFVAPSLQVTGENGLLLIKDMHGDLNTLPGIKGLSVGSMALSVGSIEGAGKGTGSFNLTSFAFKAQSGVSGEAIDSRLTQF